MRDTATNHDRARSLDQLRNSRTTPGQLVSGNFSLGIQTRVVNTFFDGTRGREKSNRLSESTGLVPPKQCTQYPFSLTFTVCPECEMRERKHVYTSDRDLRAPKESPSFGGGKPKRRKL
eukprot:29843-Amorphochlora_amoeboformis.AAC.1